MNFKKTTFPNGLRVITVPIKKSPTVIVLVIVETGSNYETKAENGLSHFLEHMCFKGTTKRSKASAIAKELDLLGAQNNAFTSNELTGYYAKAAQKHFPKLFEIISDLYLNPILPEEDLEKERGVILEEINMYEDLPQKKVWDVLSKLVYGDVSAGRSILGPRENIKQFKRQDFVNYRNKHYVASATAIIVVGDIKNQSVLYEVRKKFRNISSNQKLAKPVVKTKQKAPALMIHKKKTDQTHMVMGFHTYRAGDKRIPATILLAEILGKGMSSRLFTKLRDEMGACYYIDASHNQYTDHGLLTISTGISAFRVREVTKVLIEECNRLSKVLVSREELEKAKEHHLGHLHMGLETVDALAEFYADQEVCTRKLKRPLEIDKMIRLVTEKDILNTAKDIFRNQNLNLAIVGNISDKRNIKKALSFK